jgi:hypothetical protein
VPKTGATGQVSKSFLSNYLSPLRKPINHRIRSETLRTAGTGPNKKFKNLGCFPLLSQTLSGSLSPPEKIQMSYGEDGAMASRDNSQQSDGGCGGLTVGSTPVAIVPTAHIDRGERKS